MKKLIAVLLCIVCLFSSVGMTASAANIFNEVITNITINMGLEPDEPIIYGIIYDSNRLLTGVTIMYKPSPTFTFTRPGTYTVTSDIPLSVDHKFVCWEDEETGKLYYAGDKIYIDGQKTLLAVWQPKTDNNTRPIRAIVTAIEALRRTLQAFFGFYKMEFVPDPTADIKEEDLIVINGLVSEEHDYNANKRYYKIALETTDDGVVYDAFSINDKIFFGGRFENVEVTVEKRDEQGNIVYDKYGNILYTKEIQTQLRDTTEYSAQYEMKKDVYESNGKKYQLIEVTLTDGVPDPQKGEYVTFVIPRGMLRYTDGSGKVHTNKTYAFAVLTTTEM